MSWIKLLYTGACCVVGGGLSCPVPVRRGIRQGSSARVNWIKSGACLVGQWSLGSIPGLPWNLKWGKGGTKILGVYLGTEEF